MTSPTAIRQPHRPRATSFKACYVSASAGTDLAVIRALLTERDIRLVEATEATHGQAPTAPAIARLIALSDFVIACVTGTEAEQQVYSIGVARGAGRPVLLIVSPELLEIPAMVGGTYALHAEPNDAGAIAFALEQLLRGAPISQVSVVVAPVPRPPLGERADMFLSTLRGLTHGTAGAARDLQHLVVEALRAGGVDAVYVTPASRGADVAVWDDELEPWNANPLLIKIEPSLDSAMSAGTVLRLPYFAQPNHLRLALVLYAIGEAPILTVRTHPEVLVLAINTLLQRMRTESFAEAIIGLRGQDTNGHAAR